MKMQSREGNYDLDYKGMRYVSFIYVCWQRFNYCKVLNLEKSNAASSKQVSAHFVVEGALRVQKIHEFSFSMASRTFYSTLLLK